MNRVKASSGAATRIGFVCVLVLVFTVTANAYTVVMRSGRRVEISSRFVVMSSTLTYEVSPGVQVTLAVAAIDIPATEKANNEQPGSLLRRIPSSLPESQAATEIGTPSVQARRTITNRELESSRLRRRESEVAYENRRKQLGLPSVEGSRKQADAESDQIRLELQQQRVAEQNSEGYWRERAAALRTEMAVVDAELAYVRARLDEGPRPGDECFGGSWRGLTGTIIRGVPFGNFGRRQIGNFGGRPAFPQRSSAPNIFVAPGRGLAGAVGPGSGAPGQVFVNRARPPRPRGVGGGPAIFAGGVVFGSSAPAYDLLYERSALITHFNELAAARAGLRARWRELEEEARRAGVSPGWLRP